MTVTTRTSYDYSPDETNNSLNNEVAIENDVEAPIDEGVEVDTCSSYSQSLSPLDIVESSDGIMSNNSIEITTKEPSHPSSEELHLDEATTIATSSSSSDSAHDAPSDDVSEEKATNNVTVQKPVDQSSTSKTSSTTASSSTSAKKKKTRIQQMYTTADWWSLWIGLISFGIGVALTFIVPFEIGSERKKYIIPQPMKWSTNPIDAWDIYNGVGIFLLIAVFCCLYILSCRFMGKLEKKPTWKYIAGFWAMSLIACLAFWIGRNETLSGNGLGYALWSIIFGMIVSNTPIGKGDDRLDWLKLVAKDGEFFIKCSLVLIAVEFSVLASVGWQAIVVSWIGSPLALMISYYIGTRLFKMNDSISLLVSAGASWCGASAISGVGSVIEASSSDISLSISVVAFFTIAFTFIQPYFAIGVGMSDVVAGSWIGGSVDQTGNVVVSAAIISDEAMEVAAVVKIVLNAGLGIVCTIIAFWWEWKKQREEKAAAAAANENDGDDYDAEIGQKQKQQETKKKESSASLLFLWDKFPKFILGFIICSGILTAVVPRVDEGDALTRSISSLNKWWFAIAFVGIGICTDIKKLWEGAVKSGVVKLYLCANTLDMLFALALSYAVF